MLLYKTLSFQIISSEHQAALQPLTHFRDPLKSKPLGIKHSPPQTPGLVELAYNLRYVDTSAGQG